MFFLLQHDSVEGLLTFYKNMFGKSLVLELWSKNLKANQDAGFFNLEYLKNISWLLQVGVVRHAKSDDE